MRPRLRISFLIVLWKCDICLECCLISTDRMGRIVHLLLVDDKMMITEMIDFINLFILQTI